MDSWSMMISADPDEVKRQCSAMPGRPRRVYCVIGRCIQPGPNLGACSPLKHCDTNLTAERRDGQLGRVEQDVGGRRGVGKD